ncbi:PREDICTED: piggyBac transposable element-derived protein 4-like [Acropora digitifera]|uniref:piggyBac transposable element-derived protein 4-like n=1 Tax=Acropora digitifera TaxID=70779 RepID=UPI00077AE539|nr:PREDICTED: piggyBac transposable element-derived protein 4-like [Acropora digitifera]
MGLVTKPNFNSYWSTDPVLSSPFFPSLMSRTRFFQILWYLHFADNTHAPSSDSADYNKLDRIQPFLDLVIVRFQEVYTPERQLVIDETLIKFKGKVHFRQFMPTKLGRFGMKAFTLAESTSGYVLKIYTGKENNEVQKGLYNYYTSVALFEELEERKTLACGTVRSNRVALPREICGVNEKAVKDLKRGECLYRQKGNLTCVTWRDRKPVSVLATLPTSATESSPVERSVRVNVEWEKKQFPRPESYQSESTAVQKGVGQHISSRQVLSKRCWIHAKPCCSDITFNCDHFHYPVSKDTRSTSKVHIQNVKTIYSCAICDVRMCPEPCFQRYHTLQHYYYDDESQDGPHRLKEARGRPYQRGRRRSLRN